MARSMLGRAVFVSLVALFLIVQLPSEASASEDPRALAAEAGRRIASRRMLITDRMTYRRTVVPQPRFKDNDDSNKNEADDDDDDDRRRR